MYYNGYILTVPVATIICYFYKQRVKFPPYLYFVVGIHFLVCPEHIKGGQAGVRVVDVVYF
jgi:hypothetical protein